MITQQLDKIGQSLECNSISCPNKLDCAQHYTAGDFRSESGRTPNVIKIDDSYVCDGTMSDSLGMLVFKQGQLVMWSYDER